MNPYFSYQINYTNINYYLAHVILIIWWPSVFPDTCYSLSSASLTFLHLENQLSCLVLSKNSNMFIAWCLLAPPATHQSFSCGCPVVTCHFKCNLRKTGTNIMLSNVSITHLRDWASEVALSVSSPCMPLVFHTNYALAWGLSWVLTPEKHLGASWLLTLCSPKQVSKCC